MRVPRPIYFQPLTMLLFLLAVMSCLFAPIPLAGQAVSGQKTFSSPTAAVEALMAAARSGDPEQLVPIIGSGASDLINSGDLGIAKQVLVNFVSAYDEKHSISVEAQGFEFLQVGKGDWPFPYPIVRDGNVWYFDIARGDEEIVDRRIGRNELGAIAVCEGYVQSQIEYGSKGHDGNLSGVYARQFHSDPGKHNGLYWPAGNGEPKSPIGPLVASAAKDGNSAQSAENPTPYYGYFYRILTAQGPAASGGAKNYVVDGKMTGGFALVAYPVQYRTTGIMTFIVSQDGVVYQQDLGDQTGELASQIAAYNPDDSWQPAQ
jgi:hypothetical protein